VTLADDLDVRVTVRLQLLSDLGFGHRLVTRNEHGAPGLDGRDFNTTLSPRRRPRNTALNGPADGPTRTLEVNVMRHNLIFSIAAAAALLLAGPPSWAEEEMNPAAMAKALPQASVSLENATRVSDREGKPLSVKYEIEKGALQLSVYTMKGDRFSELILDLKSGAVAKDEWITEADDLQAAQAQAAAMAKAKLTLDVAKGNAGYRAVSVTPALEGGRPVATVVLMKGEDVKKVTEKLD
jgi:hypothetical protein